MSANIKCEKCGSSVRPTRFATCLCDKDFCTGQRCGANDMIASYVCENPDCKFEKDTTDEYMNYMARHCK